MESPFNLTGQGVVITGGNGGGREEGSAFDAAGIALANDAANAGSNAGIANA